ncbi:MAG: aldose 1-epimerase family protein [Bacteroidetes bacterium]|nr:aldose 1-epimerase family protein [Bacteroidota bacterium]
MYTIENEIVRVVIKSAGAELESIYNKHTALEYLWDANPVFWAKKSPVLFPLVGTLKKDTYYFEGKSYLLSRHGFARDMDFVVTSQQKDSVTFLLESNNSTLTKYPFSFRFSIIYTIAENQLRVTYKILNTGNKKMFFSVGGHPAFKVPLAVNTAYPDYYLQFNKPETTGKWPISKDGLIQKTPEPFFNNSTHLPLTKDLFYKDALVFKHLNSDKISLLSDKTPHGLEFDFTGFPYLGIWAAKNADFVCIEPWCGIADSVDTNQQLVDKEGINRLGTDETFEKSWTVKLF